MCAYNGEEYFNSYVDRNAPGTTLDVKGAAVNIFSNFIKKLIVWAKKDSSIQVFDPHTQFLWLWWYILVKTSSSIRGNKPYLP